jgi:hypothetical protein
MTLENLNDLNDLIGKTYNDNSSENKTTETTETKQTVYYADLPKGTRILHPDTITTMEYNPDRWNLHLDDNNKIINVTKG